MGKQNKSWKFKLLKFTSGPQAGVFIQIIDCEWNQRWAVLVKNVNIGRILQNTGVRKLTSMQMCKVGALKAWLGVLFQVSLDWNREVASKCNHLSLESACWNHCSWTLFMVQNILWPAPLIQQSWKTLNDHNCSLVPKIIFRKLLLRLWKILKCYLTSSYFSTSLQVLCRLRFFWTAQLKRTFPASLLQNLAWYFWKMTYKQLCWK